MSDPKTGITRHELCPEGMDEEAGGSWVTYDDHLEAVLAERERCAGVAEEGRSWHKLPSPTIQREKFYQKHIKSAWAQCSNRIAAAIREDPS